MRVRNGSSPSANRCVTHADVPSSIHATPSGVGASRAEYELGPDEVRATKENLGWPLEPTFHVPDEARQAFAETRERGREEKAEWDAMCKRMAEEHPETSYAARETLRLATAALGTAGSRFDTGGPAADE